MEAHELLIGLDDRQQQAVSTETQPLAILAGAGSGKTRVLTRRIAFRCAMGDADARHVLALTFTRKAAAELTGRLGNLGFRDLPAAGTFHAIAHAQLRQHWQDTGARPPTLLESKIRILGQLLGARSRLSPMDLAAEVEWAKARLISPAAYAEAAAADNRRPPAGLEVIADMYQRYEDEKHKRGVIDFDDLLVQAIHTMAHNRDLAAAQRWRFRHFFVDEFQDVNPLQFQLLQAWLGDRLDLCVVGDPNQAIYRWNGADASFLNEFPTIYPGAEVVELRDNYRSTPQILAAAAAVLAGDHGVPRPLNAHVEDDAVPTVVSYADETAEANGIARAIRDLHGPRVPWSAQAVLVRTNAQTAVIEAALRRAGIPHRVRGGTGFLEDPFVRNLLSDLRRSRKPFTTELADLIAMLDADDATYTDERRAAIETLVKLGTEFAAIDPHAIASGYPSWLTATIRGDDAEQSGNGVDVATFHAAKGLEWPVVHVAGVEDGYVPIGHARTLEQQEEERRLFYVAVTRAERVLRCTWSEQRTFGTRTSRRVASPYLHTMLQAIGILGAAKRPGSALAGVTAAAEGRAELKRHAAAAEARDEGDPAVLVSLREWRHTLARRVGLPDHVILPDQTLAAVARSLPHTTEELVDLPGVGPIKLAEYGPALLEVVAQHRATP